MRLFDYTEDFSVIPIPTTLAIKEFRDIYNRDTTRGKSRSFLELTGCYYMASMASDNPYKSYKTEDRLERINNDIFVGVEKLSIEDPLIHDAIVKLIELEDASLFKMYLRTSIRNIHKLKDFLEAVDLDERDKNDKLIHDASKFASNIERAADLTKNLRELERQIELEENKVGGRIRGGGEDEYDI